MSLQSTTAGAGPSSSVASASSSSAAAAGPSSSMIGARPNLIVDEMLSEDEARRRREQLNRRPSYRMILKDLETVGSHDKMQMKRELLDESGGSITEGAHRQQQRQQQQREAAASAIEQQQQQQQLLLPTTAGGDGNEDRSGRVSIGRSSPYGASPLSNEGSLISSAGGGGGGGQNGGGPSPLMLRNLATPTIPTMDAMLRSPSHQQQQQQMRNAAEMLAASSAAVAQRLNMIPSLPRTLLGGGDMPSQPQPHMLTSVNNPSPMLSAVAAAAVANNLLIQPSGELINLGAKPGDGLQHFSQHSAVDWQTLAAYQQHQQQQQQNASNHNNSFMGSSIVGPSMGLGNRQGSASLTSLSDNDTTNDSNRKRQVRLLKNREAAKECRRKKKEYVKCLENRVAVLENQNKALIEELKTLKELYCQKGKSELT